MITLLLISLAETFEILNRTELKQLTRARIREAKLLLDNGKYSGAYYLSGYSIECAIKACIARRTRRHEFPDKAFVNKIYTHDLVQLMSSAGLKVQLDADIVANSGLAANWSTVKDWNEKSRYEFKTELQARDLYQSIVSRSNGMLRWIRQYW